MEIVPEPNIMSDRSCKKAFLDDLGGPSILKTLH